LNLIKRRLISLKKNIEGQRIREKDEVITFNKRDTLTTPHKEKKERKKRGIRECDDWKKVAVWGKKKGVLKEKKRQEEHGRSGN